MINQAGHSSEMKPALETLFDRHYSDGSSALKRFRERLSEVRLDFDVEANIRVLDSPPQASFPRGLPSFVHYFIYGTRFGTVKKLPVDPGDPAHALRQTALA